MRLLPYIYVTPAEKEAAAFASGALIFQSSGLGGVRAMRNKEWSHENFSALVRILPPSHRIIQIGSARDPQLPKAQDLRGRTSIRESAALLSRAAAFIGLVGFPMHLARAVGCPSVIIYGGREKPEQTGYICNENLGSNLPCSPCWRRQTCDHDLRCMTEITPSMAREAIDRVLCRTDRLLPDEEVVLGDSPKKTT